MLVVALNSDASVARLKGPTRPVNPLVDRAGVIGALAVVDLVTAFDADSPVELLQLVRPEVYAKGGDYTPAMLPETPVVEALGGEVHILDYLADHSTSAIVARAQQPAPAPAGVGLMSGVLVLGDALLDVDVDRPRRADHAGRGAPVLDVTAEVERPGGAALAAALSPSPAYRSRSSRRCARTTRAVGCTR